MAYRARTSTTELDQGTGGDVMDETEVEQLTGWDQSPPEDLDSAKRPNVVLTHVSGPPVDESRPLAVADKATLRALSSIEMLLTDIRNLLLKHS